MVVESMPPRFWCHECATRVETRTDDAGAELCCQVCSGNFVEEIEDDDPPEEFFARETDADVDANAEDDMRGMGMPGLWPSPMMERELFGDLFAQMGAAGPSRPTAGGAQTQFGGNAATTRDAQTSTTAQGPSSPSEVFAELIQGLAPSENSDAAAPRRTRRARFINRDGDPVEFYVSEGEGELGPVWGMLTGLLNAPTLPGFVGNPNDYAFGDYSDLLNQLMMNDPNRHGAPPAAQQVVERLPHHKITTAEVEASAECPVCKDMFAVDEDVQQLPCLHDFHPDCILPWLKQHNSCPVCRYELPTDDADYERRRQETQASQTSTH